MHNPYTKIKVTDIILFPTMLVNITLVLTMQILSLVKVHTVTCTNTTQEKRPRARVADTQGLCHPFCGLSQVFLYISPPAGRDIYGPSKSVGGGGL